ncbi:2-oxoacid:acceptor oxidoreductase family protein [Candidatus Poribacteria bacterium]|nr:2-oxoacid:acceptor oxidoreductase family protein [Candidatus Poribacteria bacterium]
MIEIRFHGRGGQGAVIAAKVLADAFFREGKHVQSFPVFGTERRGAPIAAFTRVADEHILVRCNIYKPDIVVVLDPLLLNETDVTAGLKSGGVILLNWLLDDASIPDLGPYDITVVNATDIAVHRGLGTRINPIVNTSVLGAFARVTGLVGIESVVECIRDGVPKGKDKNADAAREAYEQARVVRRATAKSAKPQKPRPAAGIVFSRRSEMPLGDIARGGVSCGPTGSWRHMRPRYENKLSPCTAACPAGESVEAWLRSVEAGEYAEACRLIKSVNPLPRVCGRVCFHPCESKCNREKFDMPVAINSLERFVADHAKALGGASPPKAVETGKRVGIIGSGPAGLSCAYHLALRGHSVTIYEAEGKLGGLLRYGIPAYRLPKDVLDEEIEDIIRLGIEVRTGARIEDLNELRGLHDVLFVATGLGKENRLHIPGEEGKGVMGALKLLRLVSCGSRPDVGGKALIVGGGNAAVDAARSALRLGARPTIIYRRSREQMPAYAPEVEEAQKEGVNIIYLAQPVEIVRKDGRVIGCACVRNQLGEADDSGRGRPAPLEGSNFFVEADSVIVAAGEHPDDQLIDAYSGTPCRPAKAGSPNKLTLDDNGAFRILSDVVFAGGDLISATRTVAHAIGSGRQAALLLDKSLGRSSGTVPIYGPRLPGRRIGTVPDSGENHAESRNGEAVGFENINLDYFRAGPRVPTPMLPIREREGNFVEIISGVGSEAAAREAGRCFHCGACISCDNCYVYCPDLAIKKLPDGAYSIDYDYCKGCGLCVHECPRNAMAIAEEASR